MALGELAASGMTTRCWAARMGGCSASMSDEHPISAHVFDSEVLDLHGAEWLPESVQSLPLRRISSRVLCKRHNELLSPLDSAAGDFARELRRLNSPSSKGALLVHGPTIERWCVKALLGIIAAGWHRPGGVRVTMGDVSAFLVRFAYGNGSLPAGCGLHMLTYECDFEHRAEAVSWKPLVGNETGSHILGLLVGLPPVAFALALEPGDITPAIQYTQLKSHVDWRDVRAFYRPARITCRGSHGSEFVIELSWQERPHRVDLVP